MIRAIHVSLISLLLASGANSETTAEYLQTPAGFYYWLGSMSYQAKACNFKIPDKLVDFTAARAGVTKEMVVKVGSVTVREGYEAAKAAAAQEGVEAMCERVKPSFEKAMLFDGAQ